MEREHIKGGLRVISIIEAIKGILILLAGFGLLEFMHTDVYLAAEQLVRYLHLNPESRYPRIFLDLADHVTDRQLWVIALFALFCALARFVEAYGLWHERLWAESFGLLAGGMYIPLELFEIARGVTWPKIILLIVNAGVVGYLSCIVYQMRQKRKHAIP